MKDADEKTQAGATSVKCDEIQSVLFDYMTHELGQARSDFVREHVRKCGACQKAALEIQATLALLGKAASETAGAPERLTDERRKKVQRAFVHPILHKIEKYHIPISILIAVVLIVILVILVSTREVIEEVTCYPVNVGRQLPDKASGGVQKDQVREFETAPGPEQENEK
jgi:predicted anti-sigma-YlaC factor YlaD